MKRNMQQWIVYGKNHQRYYFFYEDKVLDLTEFLSRHPGGRQTLIKYGFKDITDVLFTVFPHKKNQTLITLQKYVIGNISKKQANKRLNQEKNSVIKEHIPPNKNLKKVCFVNNGQAIASQINDKKQQYPQVELQKKLSRSVNKEEDNYLPDNVKSNKTLPENGKKLSQQVDKRFEISKRFFQIKIMGGKKILKQELQRQQQLNSPAIDELEEVQHKFRVPVLKVHHLKQY